ncbi:MAG: hypothetical protein ACFFD4_17655 [Candidatus Odinarchaeota archaeon]
MAVIEESTLIILKEHKEQLKELLSKFDDFFTEISITGLASLANKEGYQKIKKMISEFQKLGLESTALQLEQFLEELRQASVSAEARGNATILLNRLLTWQLVFSRQFEYLTAGTAVLGKKEEASMVETGQVEETVDLTLVPFSVEVLKQTKTRTSIAVSCLELTTDEIYVFRDVLSHVETSSNGPLKVNSQFFGGFNWDYTTALNKIISLENVIVEPIKSEILKVLTTLEAKWYSIRKTITTKAGELERESSDSIVEKLKELSILHQITPENMKCVPDKVLLERKAFQPENRSSLWKFHKTVQKYAPHAVLTKKDKKSIVITGLFIPKTQRFVFPSIEGFKVGTFSQELTLGENEFDCTDTLSCIGNLLLNPNRVKGHVEVILENCENLISLLDAETSTNVFQQLFLSIVLLNRGYTSISNGLKEKIVSWAIKELEKPLTASDDNQISQIQAAFLIGELLTRSQIDELVKTNTKLMKGKKKKLFGNLSRIRTIAFRLLGDSLIKKQDRNVLSSLITELTEGLVKTKTTSIPANNIPLLALVLELCRDKISEIIARDAVIDILESLYYLFHLQNTKIINFSDNEYLNLCECVYLLRRRDHPALFS